MWKKSKETSEESSVDKSPPSPNEAKDNPPTAHPDAPQLPDESPKQKGLVTPPSGLESPLLTPADKAAIHQSGTSSPWTGTSSQPPAAPRQPEDALRDMEKAQRHPRTRQVKCRVEAPGTVRAGSKLYNNGDVDFFDEAEVESLPNHLIPVTE